MLNCSSHYLPSKVHLRRGTPGHTGVAGFVFWVYMNCWHVSSSWICFKFSSSYSNPNVCSTKVRLTWLEIPREQSPAWDRGGLPLQQIRFTSCTRSRTFRTECHHWIWIFSKAWHYACSLTENCQLFVSLLEVSLSRMQKRYQNSHLALVGTPAANTGTSPWFCVYTRCSRCEHGICEKKREKKFLVSLNKIGKERQLFFL